MNVLREVRTSRGLTQEDLWHKTGVSQSRISKYERGQTGVSTPTAEVLARTLDVPTRVFEPIIREVGRPKERG